MLNLTLFATLHHHKYDDHHQTYDDHHSHHSLHYASHTIGSSRPLADFDQDHQDYHNQHQDHQDFDQNCEYDPPCSAWHSENDNIRIVTVITLSPLSASMLVFDHDHYISMIIKGWQCTMC